MLKSLFVRRASPRGLCPSAWRINPRWSAGCKAWESLACAETHADVKLSWRVSPELWTSGAAASGSSGTWPWYRGGGSPRGRRGPGCCSCSPPGTGSSGWAGTPPGELARPLASQWWWATEAGRWPSACVSCCREGGKQRDQAWRLSLSCNFMCCTFASVLYTLILPLNLLHRLKWHKVAPWICTEGGPSGLSQS